MLGSRGTGVGDLSVEEPSGISAREGSEEKEG